jgi:hypothetical protein
MCDLIESPSPPLDRRDRGSPPGTSGHSTSGSGFEQETFVYEGGVAVPRLSVLNMFNHGNGSIVYFNLNITILGRKAGLLLEVLAL